MDSAEQKASKKGIRVGTEVRGDLGRPGTDFAGRVVEIYSVALEGFEVPALMVATAGGSTVYTFLAYVTLVRGEDDAEEPRTPEEFAAMLGDVEAEFAARHEVKSFTVRIEAGTSGDDCIWQAMAPAENVSASGDAGRVAHDVLTNQDIIDTSPGASPWRIAVWCGADADTDTEPAYVLYGQD